MKLKIFLSILLFSVFGNHLYADFSEKPDFESWQVNESPYTLIYNELYYLQPETYDVAKSSKSFYGNNLKNKKSLAIQFKQILDGKGIILTPNTIPRNADYFDSSAMKGIYYIENLKPRIYIEKIGNKWYFGENAQIEIRKLHNEVYPFGADFIINLVPYKADIFFLGLKIWQWIGLTILLLLSILLFKLCTLLFKFIIRKVAVWQIGKDLLLPRYILKFSKAFSLFVSFAILKLFVPSLKISSVKSLYLIKYIGVCVDFFLLLSLWRGFLLLMNYFEEKAKKSISMIDNQLVNAVKKLGKLVFIFVTIVLIFRKLGVELSTILTGLSIGGLAIALAAQDVIKNLIGSINILIDRPFQIGDFIEAENKQIVGMVEEVGLRSTRIRTPKETTITTPNGKLAEMTVNNLGLKVYRIFRMEIGFDFDCNIGKIEEMVVLAKEKIKEEYLIKEDSLEGYISEVNKSGITVSFSFFFKVPKGSKEILQKHQFYKILLELCQQLGIKPILERI